MPAICRRLYCQWAYTGFLDDLLLRHQVPSQRREAGHALLHRQRSLNCRQLCRRPSRSPDRLDQNDGLHPRAGIHCTCLDPFTQQRACCHGASDVPIQYQQHGPGPEASLLVGSRAAWRANGSDGDCQRGQDALTKCWASNHGNVSSEEFVLGCFHRSWKSESAVRRVDAGYVPRSSHGGRTGGAKAGTGAGS